MCILGITGRETGSNKQTASKSCALSIVRQLYHLGVIEAFSGTLKKNKDTELLKAYPVKISPELENQIHEVLTKLDITPVNVSKVLVIVQQLMCYKSHICAHNLLRLLDRPSGLLKCFFPRYSYCQ